MTTVPKPASASAAVTAVGLLTLLTGAAYLLTGGYLTVAGASAVKQLEDDAAGGLGFLLQFLAGLPIQLLIAQMIGQRCGGIFLREKDELVLGAPFRRQHADGFAPFIGQPVRQEVGIRDIDRNQKLARRLPVLVVKLFDRRPDQFFVCGIGGFEPEKILAADEQAAAYE